MFHSTTSAKLQNLAIKHQVPAWSVMVDLRRAGWEPTSREVLVVLGKKGNTLINVEEYAYKAWDKVEDTLIQYAKTEECRAEWQRYIAEDMPVIGTFGLPL